MWVVLIQPDSLCIVNLHPTRTTSKYKIIQIGPPANYSPASTGGATSSAQGWGRRWCWPLLFRGTRMLSFQRVYDFGGIIGTICTCIYIHMYMHIYICMYVCVYIYIYLYMYLYVSMYIYVPIYPSIHLTIYLFIYLHTQTYVCTYCILAIHWLKFKNHVW